MPTPVHVAITPVLVDADPSTVANRQSVAERLDDLGQINAASGEVNTTQSAGWQVTINGVTVPLADYAVSPADSVGQAMVSLVIPVDAVAIGEQPRAATTTGQESRPLRTWGDGARSDPRVNIPGWKPESLGEQVAANAAPSFAEESLRSQMRRAGTVGA